MVNSISSLVRMPLSVAAVNMQALKMIRIRSSSWMVVRGVDEFVDL